MAYDYVSLSSLYASANGLNVGAPSPAGQSVADHVHTMAAIGLKESSGDPGAVNPSSGARGLWQIMPSVWEKDAGFMREFGPNPNYTDAKTNARMARYVFQHQGYTAWSTYNDGSYKNVNHGYPGQQAAKAAGDVLTNAVGGPISEAWAAATKWLNPVMATIGVSVLGLALVIFGVVLLVKGESGVKLSDVGKVVGKVAAVP